MVAKRNESGDEYDGDFLELWDANELTNEEVEISELFVDQRHERERTPSPFLKRSNPFKAKRVASEIHIVPRKETNQVNAGRRRPYQQRKPVVKETTSQICKRLNLHVRINNPLAKTQSVATQASFDCRDCTQLETKLKAAELEV